jgi:hypothetical protein
MFGGGGEVDGEGGFSRPALLISNHDCFHERENIGILAFMKAIIRTGMAGGATRHGSCSKPLAALGRALQTSRARSKRGP